MIGCRTFNIFLIINCIFVISNAFPEESWKEHGVDDEYNDNYMHPEFKDEDLKYYFDSSDKEHTAEYWIKKAQKIVEDNIQKPTNTKKAKNIIIFLGDGLSVPTTSATRSYKGNESEPLSYETLPFTGMAKTYCVDRQVADSACTTTAYLCGVKTNFQTIGVNANVKVKDCLAAQVKENQTPSIAKWAIDAKKAAGIVTTTRLTDASPVGAYAHIAFRDWENDEEVKKSGCNPAETDDIAKQLIRNDVGSKLSVILGGGRSYFIPKGTIDEEGDEGARLDGVNLIKEWQQKKGSTGKYVWNKKGLKDIQVNNTDFLLGIFETGHMLYNLEVLEKHKEDTEPTLSEMVDKAIDMLSKEENGYFLFVEGGRIDHAHHANYAKISLDETREFSKAIQLALKKVNVDETLLVVTSDHSHSFSYAGYPHRSVDILGTIGTKADDKIDQIILTYANGEGYKTHVKEEGGRNDPSKMERPIMFRYPATAPKSSETHGGEDVAVYAIGPWSHLFTGNYEQHTIPHMMAYAACIGNGVTACD